MAKINGIEVKVGQWWRTRDGNMVKQIREIEPLRIVTSDYISYLHNGNWNNSKLGCPLDLVTLMEESKSVPLPKTVEIEWWVNVYPDRSGQTCMSKEAADERALPIRIACIHVKRTVTEGEGL